MNNLNNDSVSVGIVTLYYNNSDDLNQLLDSLESQTFSDFYVVIVDNGSNTPLQLSARKYRLEIIRSPINRGVGGGFNYGIRELLGKGECSYLWLLDSDITLDPEALHFLVAAMQCHPDVGLAGSLIINSHTSELIVEAGAFFDLRTGIAFPLYCNEPVRELRSLIDVDYVGAGVSFLRRDLVDMIGTYDERYFFLGEEMDYGLRVHHHGYKVVAVPQSIVYHPPFTEKRKSEIYSYYGVRNTLLTLSKHAPAARLPFRIFQFLRKSMRIMVLRLLTGEKHHALLIKTAVKDFVLGNFSESATLRQDNHNVSISEGCKCAKIDSFFVFGTGTIEAVTEAIAALRENCSGKITLVVQSYRKCLFEQLSPDEWLLSDDRKRSILGYLPIMLKLLFSGATAVQTDAVSSSISSYAAIKSLCWDPDSKIFRLSPRNIFALWQPIVALLLGEVSAVLIFPVIAITSWKIRQNNNLDFSLIHSGDAL
ncbi:galactofuranosyl transferase GlfT2 [Geobacter sp. OR-1]|uniref:glycosyltransferase family 2 protein n=1 Tax=Geobacter sp. OR-1 TaxID=1266765 RepID=UPI000544039F|nr:glycosyltransferase family 2 protein [Geobacter sp. OR-1]GAM11539.1 galactofuranosyl transferase GlfT2 [Geobacter sp. OR-1]